jgi:hypothetical protein
VTSHGYVVNLTCICILDSQGSISEPLCLVVLLFDMRYSVTSHGHVVNFIAYFSFIMFI